MRERGRVALGVGRVGRDDRHRERPGGGGRAGGRVDQVVERALRGRSGGRCGRRWRRRPRRAAACPSVAPCRSGRRSRSARARGRAACRRRRCRRRDRRSRRACAGQAARIAASVRAAEKPLPIPPRSTAAPRSIRARPGASVDLGAGPPSGGGAGGALLELLEAAVVAGGDERGEDRRVEPARGLRPDPERRAQRALEPLVDLDPLARGPVEAREVAGRIEAGERPLAGLDLCARGERAPGARGAGRPRGRSPRRRRRSPSP